MHRANLPFFLDVHLSNCQSPWLRTTVEFVCIQMNATPVTAAKPKPKMAAAMLTET